MALKGLFSSAKSATSKVQSATQRDYAGSVLSNDDKLAMLDELERSGLGWFWATDVEGKLTYLSEAIADRLSVPMDRLVGHALPAVFGALGGDGRTKSLALKLGARKSFTGIAVGLAQGESDVVINLSGRPVFDDEGRFEGFRGTGSDITEQYHREEETERLAKFDSLTGLSNRHRMAQMIDGTLTAFKAAKRNCALMMLDLDRFKQVNDTLGHAAGDELLKQVAARLKRSVDKDCEIGRLGGDEFQIMLPDMDDRGALGEVAAKIIAMLTQPYSLEEGRCVIGASVGIAIAPHDGVTREEVVRSADLALYAAKNGGRGQFRFYTGDLENETIFRKRLEGDLLEAIREEQLFLKFQPVVSAESMRVVSLEALVCWNHPQRGEIDEEEFQSIVDGSSLIVDVGEWTIRQACKEAALWPEALRVSVNVPASHFTAEGFVTSVSNALEESELAPQRLELEVKETVFLGDTNVVDKTLAALFKLGARLSLDEFGTGYSSLSYLRRAPFDTIKIGQKFFAGAMERDGREIGLIKAIVALAKALGMQTTATGLETVQLVDRLKDAGVDSLQGSIYSDPVSASDVMEELAVGTWRIEPGHRVKRARRRTVYRKIQVINDDHSYEVTLRNLSKTGAYIEGLVDVPVKTQFVVDLGGGQLAVATVTRSNGDTQGLEFETALVDDGAGGLCTRHRVSPYELAAAGAPLAALSTGDYKGMQGGMLDPTKSVPKFMYANPAAVDAA
ncbi:diguanylate cyclase /phosphodiesterase (GGDEF & EAL domains) with PAS /PAC sensor(s) [Altererythrobacter epoxidivorans]|uniref:Diguanylate cyclase /phosphodiesterase (GGDEF & EAL domains) with PAS /PAC sensor(S) n=1 Tax=Altererythrobacter epoxidivorans TaxID=361183 RepID=A0A0M3TAF3_9SPHN|nr:diguanylate cyclase /phosphodiesterase (GGDEF & EAL domains) with PAS /PAC sensor(s) [Altererythrobacter epoxidivorans]